MKILRNQGFVIVLAVFALFLVGKNLVWPFLGPKFARRSPAPQAKAAPAASETAQAASAAAKPANPPSAAPAKTVSTQNGQVASGAGAADEPGTMVVPDASMNLRELWSRTPEWADSPQRDPFKMRGGVNDKSAREQLTLTGILRQTEQELAVLNNRVLAEGDTILGFRIETVEPDRVWVSGPNGREMLEFKYNVQSPPARLGEGNAPTPVAANTADAGAL